MWAPSPGLPRFDLPAPTGRDERWLGIARGPVASVEAAGKHLTETMRKQVNTARAKGLMSREWFHRLARPGDGTPPEIIGVDIWFDADGMQEVYSDPAEMAALRRPLHRAAADLGVEEARGPLGRVVGEGAVVGPRNPCRAVPCYGASRGSEGWPWRRNRRAAGERHWSPAAIAGWAWRPAASFSATGTASS